MTPTAHHLPPLPFGVVRLPLNSKPTISRYTKTQTNIMNYNIIIIYRLVLYIKKKCLKNQKSSINYLLSCADTRLLWGLNLPGSPYILHTNFSLHGSSRTANSWNISSNFCTTGVYTGSCVATCCSAFGGLPWP